MNNSILLHKCKLLFVAPSLLAASLSAFGQTTVAIAPNKLNVLFVGVDNPVSVAASGSTDDKLTVSISGGSGMVSKLGTGLYNVRVSTVTDDCTVTIYVDGKPAGSSGFRVRNLPAPMGTIGGYQSGANVPADALRAQAGVGVYVKDFPFEVRYEVVGFTFNIDDDKGNVKSTDCSGMLFSSEAIQYMDQYAKAGHTITIDAIRVKNPDGRVLKIPSLVYYIK